jgi:hypothetical protein
VGGVRSLPAALPVFGLAVLLLACRAEEPPAAQTPSQAAPANGTPGLCLELEAPREPLHLGEPFSIVASLVNCGSAPQQVQDLLSPEFGFLQVWVRAADGKELLHRPVINRDARGKPLRALKPGERLSAFVPVYCGPDGWVITQPGEYTFRAQYSAEATPLQSKPVSVDVVPPKGRTEQQAANLMMSREAGLLLISGRDERGEGSRRFEALARQYSESPLASYARLALAVAGSRERFDPETKTFVKAGCEGSVEQLRRALPRVRDPLLAASGTASWIRCLRQLGREGEAEVARSNYLRSHPYARNVPVVSQLIGLDKRE